MREMVISCLAAAAFIAFASAVSSVPRACIAVDGAVGLYDQFGLPHGPDFRQDCAVQ